MINLHVLMVGSLPETAFVHARDALDARSVKAREKNIPPTEIVTVPLIGAIEDGTHKKTSPEMASMASHFLSRTQDADVIRTGYALADGQEHITIGEMRERPEIFSEFLKIIDDARSIAGSTLSQADDAA